ncbi:MAG: DUF169 domain-containing protein [Desulfococcaceae bacterium]
MDYKAFSEEISRLIRPQSYPLGVKLLKDVSKLPKEAVRPSKYGIKISLCQWTTMARRWGRIMAAVADDINCTPCLAALGLKRMKDSRPLSEYFLEMGYFSSIELAEKATKRLNPIPSGEIAGIAVFPLETAPADPDIVLIYGTPAQMAVLAAAYLYHYGELIESETTGFGISCLSSLKPYFTGKPAFVHPGRGERILAGTDESEMFFTFPADYCEPLLDGLKKTHEKGTRYPVQSYMIYQPPIIKPMKNLGDKLTDLVVGQIR